MQLTITSVDYAPEELDEQIPIVVNLQRQISGNDRPDYWLGEVKSPIRWMNENHELRITHLVLTARWAGTSIEPGVKDLPVGIAYVTDETLLEDEKLDLKKCIYIAIGVLSESGGGEPAKKNGTPLSGTIGRFLAWGTKNEVNINLTST